MFGLFKKEPNETDSVAYLTRLAATAYITPVLESGKYSAFLIMVKGTGAELASYFKNHTAMNKFVEEIENRLLNREFDDDIPETDAAGFQKDRSTSEAKRVVVSSQNKQLFNWTL